MASTTDIFKEGYAITDAMPSYVYVYFMRCVNSTLYTLNLNGKLWYEYNERAIKDKDGKFSPFYLHDYEQAVKDHIIIKIFQGFIGQVFHIQWCTERKKNLTIYVNVDSYAEMNVVCNWIEVK